MANFAHNTFDILVSYLFYTDDDGKYEVEKAHWQVIECVFLPYCRGEILAPFCHEK